MELTYDTMAAFMEKYFPAYSELGQDPATAHRMYDYYAPDFVFTGYVGLPETSVYSGADAFLAFDTSHPGSYERLTPEELIIDEARGVVAAVIKFEFIDTKTGEVLVTERGMARYQLALDDDGKIKVKHLLFFPQRTPPGALTGTEVFRTT